MTTVGFFPEGDPRQVALNINYDLRGPFNISFQCARRALPGTDPSTIVFKDKRVCNLFKNAVEGKAHKDMQPNTTGMCALPGSNKGHCGNKRQGSELAECRCPSLDRVGFPDTRKIYEDKVIQTILNHPQIVKAKARGHAFQFNLAVFGSGRLLGEEILLFRLVHALHNQGLAGTLNLFFIDRDEYKPIIEASNPKTALESCSYLNEFLKELVECLPPSLVIKGAFYGEADDYIKQAQINPAYKHDLLIGADIETAVPVVKKIDRLASNTKSPKPLVLLHEGKKGIGFLCHLSAHSDDCSRLSPLELPLPATVPREASTGLSQDKIVLIAGVVISLIIGGVVIYKISQK